MQNLPDDFFTAKAAKKRGPERHLTKNYNFAGPGTEYFARKKGSDFYEKLMKEAGRPLVGSKPYNKPYDKLYATLRCPFSHFSRMASRIALQS